MTPENFAYWLQGFIEIQNPTTINSQQLQEIKNHLNIVLSQAPIKEPKSDPLKDRVVHNKYC